jgi:crotonobetainyl-CoA:carnitine CoA-transferase CaiB-like acyl-CoA transferase
MFPDAPNNGLPLSGLKVVDCTIFQQGTYSTVMLADFGADVIKVEGPESPDPGRGLSEAYFQSYNRNKRGIIIDLKNPKGIETILRLVDTADVFVQNMRQGVMEKLGLGYDDLARRNPAIIYASASGYGAKGPQRSWAAMDILGQARGGTMSVQGPPDGPPMVAFGGMADQVGAVSLSYGVLMALVHRMRTGEGQFVDASLLGGQIMLQTHNITSALFNGKAPVRVPRAETQATWNTYRCRDDRYLAVSMLQSDRWWPAFCEATNRQSWLTDERYCDALARNANRTALIADCDALFLERDQMDWVNHLCAAGLPAAPVQDYLQLAEDPQVVANGYIVPFERPDGTQSRMVGPGVQLSKSPGTVRHRAPEFGEHTEEVLLEHGFTWDEIAELASAGAIGPR